MTHLTVGHRARVQVGTDTHNVTTYTWAPAVDIPVKAVAPGASEESVKAGRNTSRVAWTVYCYPGALVSEFDRIVWLGEEYSVDARPDDWTHGPRGHRRGGVVIELIRQKG